MNKFNFDIVDTNGACYLSIESGLTVLTEEEYAEKYGKDKSIQSDSIKRKERIKNIDVELENWRRLKINSEKMIFELNDRKNKIHS